MGKAMTAKMNEWAAQGSDPTSDLLARARSIADLFQLRTRRLAACSVMSDHDANLFVFAPFLLILMLVFYMYRKPIQNYFSESRSAKPSSGGLRITRKKAPVRHY